MQHIELIHTPDYQKIKKNFLEEMILASDGKPSSISYIKHHLPNKPVITHGIVQGIVIGGTNYIFSTQKISSDGTRKVLKKQTGTLPIFVTKQTLIDFLSEYLDPQADAIGVNFGFPMKPITHKNGTLDGTVHTTGTKDHTFIGLTEPVGAMVKKLFAQKFGKEIPVSVANDTICMMLSGNGTEQVSLIAGTGVNLGIRMEEKNNTTLINLEAAGFNKFTSSEALKEIDKRTKNPGQKLFEKTISGKYLSIYFNQKIKEQNLPISPITTSQELSELSHENHHDIAGDLARAIITRSAFLVATAIAGVYEFCVISHQIQPHSTLIIIGEGSLLWDGWHYLENVQKQLTLLGIATDEVKIKHIKDSSINGAIRLLMK